MCMLQSTQAQGWERLMLSPASGKVWIAECTGSELGKADSHLCLLEKGIAVWLEVLIQDEIFDSFQTRQESTNILETSENPAPVMHTWIFSIFLVTGSQLMPIQAIKPDDTNKK